MEGLCDISIAGPSKITEIRNGKLETYTVEPKTLGIEPAPLETLLISSPEQSAETIRGILDGKKGPARDMAAINAASALVVADMANDLKQGLEQAYQSIDTGQAAQALQKMIAISNAG